MLLTLDCINRSNDLRLFTDFLPLLFGQVDFSSLVAAGSGAEACDVIKGEGVSSAALFVLRLRWACCFLRYGDANGRDEPRSTSAAGAPPRTRIMFSP